MGKKKNKNKKTAAAKAAEAASSTAAAEPQQAAAAAPPQAAAAALPETAVSAPSQAAAAAPPQAAAAAPPQAAAATPPQAAAAAPPQAAAAAPPQAAAAVPPQAAAAAPMVSAAAPARPAAPAAPPAASLPPPLAAPGQTPQRGRGRGARGRGRGQEPQIGRGRGQEPQQGRGSGQGPWRGRGDGAGSQTGRESAAATGGVSTPSTGRGDSPGTASPVEGATARMAALSVADTKRAAEEMFKSAPSEVVARKTYRIQPPKKTKPGSKGRPINLITNHFDFKFKTNQVFHYDVEIQPRCPKSVKRLIFSQAMNEHPVYRGFYPVFDGQKNMYTARLLPKLAAGAKATLTVTFAEEGAATRDYTIEVQRSNPCEVDLTPIIAYLQNGSTENMPSSAVQALDIVLRHLPSTRFVPVGKSFFPDQGPRVLPIGGGCELWIGYFSSIRMGWKQARINIDVSNKAFHQPQLVMDKMGEIVGRNFNPNRPLDQFQRKDVEKQLRNLKVEYRRGPQGGKRSYRVNALSPRSVQQTMFECNGREISVAQYFQQELQMPLRYPQMPCLWVGSRQKKIYIPAEVCTVVKGQVNTSKLGPEQVSKMIRQTAVPAPQRLERIKDFVRQADFNRDPFNREFGLQVADTPTTVTGRILPPPTLLYQQNNTVQPRDGVWDLRQRRFLDARSLERWCVLDYARTAPPALKRFLETLAMAARQLGMGWRDPADVMQRDGYVVERTDVVRDLSELKQRYNSPQLVLVVLPGKSKLYNAVKGAGDVEVGQLTSCVQQQTVMKADRQTAGNICQKMNAKLGGSNNALEKTARPPLLMEPTIIFGADVTHPPPDQNNKPSIAAVVATLDASYHARYAQRILVQFPTNGRRAEEMILDLATAVKELLIEFFRFNRKSKPRRIIFFRDGVSEGQFMQVMGYELEQIRKACTSLEPGYQPKITFLVVQKRHHTRLFASDLRDTVGRSQNVPPGTVVDSVLAHPTEMDYFLVSHQGIQGTSRPTHYHILHDDSNLTLDELELLTYYMCHLFSRCTRSVSNPAPSYYAHLAAYRARAHHDNYLRVNRIDEEAPPDTEAAIRACKPQTVNMYFV